MSDLAFPAKINFDKAVALESSYETTVDAQFLPRLVESCVKISAPANVSFKFYKDLQGLRTIAGTVSCDVVLQCQRCGGEFPLTLEGKFSSNCDREKAKSLQIEDRLDFIELDQVGDFALLDFIEECLLLEIPYVPRHEEGSPECVVNEDWTYGELDKEAKVSPFAALAGLKDQLKK